MGSHGMVSSAGVEQLSLPGDGAVTAGNSDQVKHCHAAVYRWTLEGSRRNTQLEGSRLARLDASFVK